MENNKFGVSEDTEEKTIDKNEVISYLEIPKKIDQIEKKLDQINRIILYFMQNQYNGNQFNEPDNSLNQGFRGDNIYTRIQIKGVIEIWE